MKRICFIIFSVICCIVLLSACSGTKQASGVEGEFRIVTSFYPMYVFTKNITEGVEGVSVHNMTKPQTGCLHDYQLLPEDLKTLSTADIFVINGAGMESFLDKVVESLPDLQVVEASEGIPLLEVQGNGVAREHAHTHEGEENSHVWLSPEYAAREISNIAAGLAQADAEHAQQYLDNAETYAQRILDLWETKKTELEPCRGEAILISHEAFDYLANEVDIEVAGTIRSNENEEPTAQELGALIEEVKEKQIKAIFAEPQYPQTALNTISKEANVPIYTLDPMVTGEEEYLNVYEKTLEQNVDTLVQALAD